MYEQGMSTAEVLTYLIGGVIALVVGIWLTTQIKTRANQDKMFMASKSAVGSQAVVLNAFMYLLAIGLLLKGLGLSD